MIYWISLICSKIKYYLNIFRRVVQLADYQSTLVWWFYRLVNYHAYNEIYFK